MSDSEITCRSLRTHIGVWGHMSVSEVTCRSLVHLSVSEVTCLFLMTPVGLSGHLSVSEVTCRSLKSPVDLWSHLSVSEVTCRSLKSPVDLWSHLSVSEVTCRSLRSPVGLWGHLSVLHIKASPKWDVNTYGHCWVSVGRIWRVLSDIVAGYQGQIRNPNPIRKPEIRECVQGVAGGGGGVMASQGTHDVDPMLD